MQSDSITTFKGNDLTNAAFGLLVVQGFAGRSKWGAKWECVCACGNITVVLGSNLTTGNTTSCGCERARVITKHGQSKPRTPEFVAWEHMIQRCTNSSDSQFYNYGGRGISVCDRWQVSFVAFFEDMGPRPSDKHSIERIDNNDGYHPKNCRWATSLEQNRNRRNNNRITFQGETLCLEDWAIRYNVNRETLRRRILRNWPLELAFTRPPSPLRH